MTSVLYTCLHELNPSKEETCVDTGTRGDGLLFLANALADLLIRSRNSDALCLAASVLATAALVFWLWRSERDFMQNHDELQQKIRTEALARAFPCAIGVVLLLSKMHDAGIAINLTRSVWILPLLPYFFILAWTKRRYE